MLRRRKREKEEAATIQIEHTEAPANRENLKLNKVKKINPKQQ